MVIDPDCLRVNPALLDNTTRVLLLQLDASPAESRPDRVRAALRGVYLAARTDAVTTLQQLQREIESALGLLEALRSSPAPTGRPPAIDEQLNAAAAAVRVAIERIEAIRVPEPSNPDDQIPF
jgi:hypothetical protein